MSFETDNRLKSYLDSNQLYREQMCLSILSVQKEYSEIKPMHPNGGPDGGRDIEAVYNLQMKTIGAIGFINGANDSKEQKRSIKKKFISDIDTAINAKLSFDAFVFFTNINITISERDEYIKIAKSKGVIFCDVFYRERLRLVLDSPEGFYIRFQYLDLPLSNEEQKSFFSRWGENIQGLISHGFTKVENMLSRILFLQEIHEPLDYFTVILKLDKTYIQSELGHFRVFISLHFVERVNDCSSLIFGSFNDGDRIDREGDNVNDKKNTSGISGGQWKKDWDKDEDPLSRKAVFEKMSSFSSIFPDNFSAISVAYSQSSFIRYPPYFCMKDFDESKFLPILNKSIAQKVQSLTVYSNGYKLLEVFKPDFGIDETVFDLKYPCEFSAEELSDPWVRIRPKISSAFQISFYELTPKRMYESKLLQENDI